MGITQKQRDMTTYYYLFSFELILQKILKQQFLVNKIVHYYLFIQCKQYKQLSKINQLPYQHNKQDYNIYTQNNNNNNQMHIQKPQQPPPPPNPKNPQPRSKSKQNPPSYPHTQKNTIMNYKTFLRQFSFGIPDNIMKILENFQIVHHSFCNNLDHLKLYRMQLAMQMQGNWCDFMELVKNIITKYTKRIDRLAQQKQSQQTKLLQLNIQNQKQLQKIKQKLYHIQYLRSIQKIQLDLANKQVQNANIDIGNIYNILKNDMKKILSYLTSIQENKQKQIKDNSNKIYQNIQKFKQIFTKIQHQHKDTATTLSTMKQTIKSMTINTKITTGTQLDQCQLQFDIKMALVHDSNKISQYAFDVLDSAAVNHVPKGNYQHVIDLIKNKDKEIGFETVSCKNNGDKPWALTPTLLVFLQGISKSNEVGRVMAWEYIKNLIKQIYEQRIKYQQQIISGMVGNSMLFDQFVVCYFIKKYRIRRLAEVKLLQLLISLKYYSKLWLRAQLFCIMMDIIRYIPPLDQYDKNNYRIDYYVQNYFFQLYQVLQTLDILDTKDGYTYIKLSQLRKQTRFFNLSADERPKSRIFSRLDKKYVDLDYCLMVCLEEYFGARKKISELLSKIFAKSNERVQGYYSIDQIIGILRDANRIYTKAPSQQPQNYPIQNEYYLMKLYLYAITSGKNNYQITNTYFLQSCCRYGWNSPFPFLHSCKKYYGKKVQAKLEISLEKINSEEGNNNNVLQKIESDISEPYKQDQAIVQLKVKQSTQSIKFDQPQSPLKLSLKNINNQRINIASRLFSQHFCILKQLKDYVTIFGTTLSNEKNIQILWKNFNQIKLVLEKGCSVLKYPIILKE